MPHHLSSSHLAVVSLILVSFLSPTEALSQSTPLSALTVAEEDRCSAYERRFDYRYSQDVELMIIDRLGGIYGPYEGRFFSNRALTDIEHIVATSEAHDSGLCAADKSVRTAFASDLLNLTLASAAVNRHQKRGYDAAEWLPEHNRCWYAQTVVEVKAKYGLSVDPAEHDALAGILASCERTAMVIQDTGSVGVSVDTGSALDRYDDNGDGRITCAEARRHGIAPVPRSHSAYRYMRDADGDGWVCELP